MKPYKLPKQEQSKIQAQIKQSGLTQAAIAKEMSVSMNVVYDWIHGRTGINMDDLAKLWKLITSRSILEQVIVHVKAAAGQLELEQTEMDPTKRPLRIGAAFAELKNAMDVHANGIMEIKTDGES